MKKRERYKRSKEEENDKMHSGEDSRKPRREKLYFPFFGKGRKEAKQEARDEDWKCKIEIRTRSPNRSKMGPNWDHFGDM